MKGDGNDFLEYLRNRGIDWNALTKAEQQKIFSSKLYLEFHGFESVSKEQMDDALDILYFRD